MRPLFFPLLLAGCLPLNGQDAPCLLLPDPGPCEAAIPAWYFDQTTQVCTEFTWGGCGGVVPFETYAACQGAGCIGDTLDVPICDSIAVTALDFGTGIAGVDHLAILVEPEYQSPIWVAYAGFALYDAEEHLIASEDGPTAPNAYGFDGLSSAEERFLAMEPGVDLEASPPPFPWTLRLFQGWMAGGADLVCEWTWASLDLAASVMPLAPAADGSDAGYFDLLGRPARAEPGRILIRRSRSGAVRKVCIIE